MYHQKPAFSLSTCIREYIEGNLKLNDRDDQLARQIEFDNLKNKNKRKLKFLIDFDSAWETFAGNTNSHEWPSGGGDWINTKNFYFHLAKSCDMYGLQLIFCFDGTMSKCFDSYEWLNKFKLLHKRVKHNFQNANYFGRIAPPFLKEYIQLMISSMINKLKLKALVSFQTIENHQRELIAFYKQNKCDGLITDDFDLIAMSLLESSVVIDLYWAKSFKFRNSMMSACLIQKEKIFKSLNMNEDQFKWYALLLSSQTSQFISGEWLIDFYKRLTHDTIDLKNPTQTGYLYIIEELDKLIHRFKTTRIPRAHMFKCILNRVIDENEDRDFINYVDSFFNLSIDNYKQEWRYSSTTTDTIHNNNNKTASASANKSTNRKLNSYANGIGSISSLNHQVNSTMPVKTNKYNTIGDSTCKLTSSSNLNLTYNNFASKEIKPLKPFLLVDDYLDYKAQMNSTLLNESINKIDHLSLIEEDGQMYIEETNLTDSFKDKHINLNMHKWVYNAYFKKKIVLPIYSEPDSDHLTLKCTEIYRPIRLNCYKLLFSGMKTNIDLEDFKAENLSCSVSVHELNPFQNADSNTILFEEIIYEPKLKIMKSVSMQIQPITEEFNIEQFWNKSHRERLEQFLFNIHCKNLIDLFFDQNGRYVMKKNIEEAFVLPCLVLRFLVLKNYLILTSKDIDAFITTFIWVNKIVYTHEKERPLTRNRDPRCAHLAALFLAGIEHFYFANDVCGRPFSEEYFHVWRYFSGSFLQTAYENYALNNTNYLKELNHNNQVGFLKDKQVFGKLQTFVLKDLSDKLIDEPYYDPYQCEKFPISRFESLKPNKTPVLVKSETSARVRSIGRGLLGMQMMDKAQMSKIIYPEDDGNYDDDQINNNNYNSNFEDASNEIKKNNLTVQKPPKFIPPVKCNILANKDLIDKIVEERRREQEEINRSIIEKRYGRLVRFGEQCMGGFNLPGLVVETVPKAQVILPEPKPKKEGTTWISINDMPMFILGKPY